MGTTMTLELSEIRRFTPDEYHRLAEAGVLLPDERVELVRGVIRRMAPKGRRHVVAVQRAIQIFAVRLAGRATVSIQDPLVREHWHSEPEPDVVLFSNPDADAYGTPESDPLLVVEVADSSLDFDRTEKAKLYAEAGVPEYWIVNLVDDLLEVHREPEAGGYRSRQVLAQGDRIAPLHYPDLEIDPGELIPPGRPG
jgi:Uma2 family endonuclease